MNGKKLYVLGPLLGGFGSQAFLGQEISADGKKQPVVMVFVPDEVLTDSMIFEQVLEENRIAVKLDHLNVITVYGLIKLEEGYARLVEFADAESLRSVFERLHQLKRRMPLEIAAAIVADACAGVNYAHDVGLEELGKPLLHEAIRPETLLVSFKGIGMVTGYGAATIAEYNLRASGNKASIRDPYTSPEQIFGGRKASTVHTDVYALGAVLFEALSGTPPFSQDASLPVAITNVQPPRRKLDQHPPEVIEIVLRALSKGARDRYHTSADMRKALLDKCPLATKKQVSDFMEELFPITNSNRQARQAMLNGGLDDHLTQPPPADEADEEDPQMVSLRSGQLRPMKQLTSRPDDQRPQAKKRTEPLISRDLPGAGEAKAVEAREEAPGMPPQKGASGFGTDEITSEVPRRALPPEKTEDPATIKPQIKQEDLQILHQKQPRPRLVEPPPESAPPRRRSKLMMAGMGLVALAAIGLAFWFSTRPEKATSQQVPIRLDAPRVSTKPVKPNSTGDINAPVPLVSAKPKPDPKPEVQKPKKKVAAPKKVRAQSRKPVKRRQRPARKKSITSMLGGDTGRLIIDAKPGSQVYIDGRLKGTLPFKAMTLKAGPHRLLVKEVGSGATYRQTVQVKANIELTVSVEFY